MATVAAVDSSRSSSVTGLPPPGLLQGQKGLEQYGAWCDRTAMWRRHVRLRDGASVFIYT
jgi:hypothetical protein